MTENLAIQCELATVQSTKETAAIKREEQIIDESITKSITCLQPEENPSPRYPAFIVKHPYILFVLISVLVILTGSISLVPQLGAQPLPDFSDPILGFEARGTVISARWRSQLNLFGDEKSSKITRVPTKCGIKNLMSEQNFGDAPAVCSKEQTFNQGKLTVKLVFATTNGESLLNAKNLKSICRLEEKIVRKYYNFNDHCHKANGTKHCCPSWSVGYYIALLNGNVSCFSIDETKVQTMSSLVRMCSKFYHNEALKPDCWDFTKNTKRLGRCDQVPDNCTTFNAVYNVLHYLTDKNFVSTESSSGLFLRYSLVLVPIRENKDFQVEIYKSRLKDNDVKDGDVIMSGYEMSQLKYEIFNERMLIELYLAAIAMLFVMVVLWVYTGSFLLTSLVGLIVVSSLVIAYFIYSVVLGIAFFPFLNILTAVFLVGIAADDAFVYLDIWNHSARERKAKLGQPPSNREERKKDLIYFTSHTMKHASLSMFVTSFTTSSAFFACLTSEITSIRLFGLYSGLSILCMFFLMVTWFPAAVIIEKTVHWFVCYSTFCRKLHEPEKFKFKTIIDKMKAGHRTFFTDFLPRSVIKLRYISLLIFSILAAGGIVVSTVKPGLQLPTSQDFQMFRESHELEKYPLKLKKNFYFESTKKSSFPINFIWGVEATDTGNQFDPLDSGSIKWDDNFDITTKNGQQWIANFIPRLKNQSFLTKHQKLSLIEDFFTYMKTNCTKDNKMCCKNSQFPYSSTVFSECMKQIQCLRIKEAQLTSQGITADAPLFDADGRLRAMTMKFDSNVAFTWSFDPADRFWREVENWSSDEFNAAPSSIKGWFISDLQFYDLQKSLSKGTLLSMSISLGIAFGVMLLITANIYISVFAIVTITCALGVTVGTLVLIGWKLNILESITMSVSVGLSVDFTLHYGVAYVLALNKTDRKSRVYFSMSSMSSAITMAAFTTFIAGAIATFGSVLSYIQMGQFLMIVMSISLVYATFFFQALCSIFGPENNSGQMTVSKLKAGYQRFKGCFCRAKEHSLEDSTNIQVLYIKKRRAEIGTINQ